MLKNKNFVIPTQKNKNYSIIIHLMVTKQLLEILVCPLDKSKLEYDKERQVLRCLRCKRDYPIREGIPIMTPSDT